MTSRATFALLTAALLAYTSPALASGSALGIKAVNATSIHDGHASPHFGVGLFFEHAVIEHALELELSTSLLSTDGAMVPVELLARVPFSLTESFSLFVGAGPLAVFALPNEGEANVHFGFSTALGGALWVDHDFGLMLSANFAGLFDHGFVPEVGGAAGVMVRL